MCQISVLDGKYKFSLQKQDNIWGQEILPPFFPLTNFLTPKKKADPLFLPKFPIPYIKEGGLLS